MNAPGKKVNKSLIRTVLLGSLALASIIYGLYAIWEVPLEQVIIVCIASILIVVGIALLALIFVAALYFLRSLRKRD